MAAWCVGGLFCLMIAKLSGASRKGISAEHPVLPQFDELPKAKFGVAEAEALLETCRQIADSPDDQGMESSTGTVSCSVT